MVKRADFDDDYVYEASSDEKKILTNRSLRSS
jgi:hypothetical protein